MRPILLAPTSDGLVVAFAGPALGLLCTPTKQDEEVLLDACETPRQYLFILLGWWTGARRREILALHYYDFDFDAHTLNISHMKNNMSGVLPVSEEIISMVKRLYQEANESDPVFHVDPLLAFPLCLYQFYVSPVIAFVPTAGTGAIR